MNRWKSLPTDRLRQTPHWVNSSANRGTSASCTEQDIGPAILGSSGFPSPTAMSMSEGNHYSHSPKAHPHFVSVAKRRSIATSTPQAAQTPATCGTGYQSTFLPGPLRPIMPNVRAATSETGDDLETTLTRRSPWHAARMPNGPRARVNRGPRSSGVAAADAARLEPAVGVTVLLT